MLDLNLMNNFCFIIFLYIRLFVYFYINMLQVIIPMAGIGSRFRDYGFKTNKYLLPINIDLQTMIELAIISLNINIPAKYFFIFNAEYNNKNNLAYLLHQLCNKYDIIYEIHTVETLTDGPACTVASIKDYLNLQEPIIISNSDQVLENWNFEEFYKTCLKYDGCVLTYTPSYELKINNSDKHSFIHINKHNIVDECKEKIILSDQALVGVHYFKTAEYFFEAYDYMIAKNMRAPNNEFYISLCYQSMIELKQKIGYHKIQENEFFWNTGEPKDYFNYLYKKGNYNNIISEDITNDIILFSNENFSVKYLKNIKGFIKNNGLIILLNSDYTITSKDIDLKNKCNIIIITSNKYYCNVKQDYDLYNYKAGWIIGDFEPSIIKTKDFEVGILTHNKNEKWDYHYHVYLDEINILLEGNMLLNEIVINKNQLFYIPKKQIASPIFLENCKILCIKTPSIIGDKICL